MSMHDNAESVRHPTYDECDCQGSVEHARKLAEEGRRTGASVTLDEAKAMLEAWKAWDSESDDPPPDQPLDIIGTLLAIIAHIDGTLRTTDGIDK